MHTTRYHIDEKKPQTETTKQTQYAVLRQLSR